MHWSLASFAVNFRNMFVATMVKYLVINPYNIDFFVSRDGETNTEMNSTGMEKLHLKTLLLLMLAKA